MQAHTTDGRPPTHQPNAAQQVARIQRRLERWELTHLRALAASLADRLEQTEAALERARADAATAWQDADTWRDQVQSLIEDLQAAGRDVAMTPTGGIVTRPMPGVDIDAVHARHGKQPASDNGYDVREGGAA